MYRASVRIIQFSTSRDPLNLSGALQRVLCKSPTDLFLSDIDGQEFCGVSVFPSARHRSFQRGSTPKHERIALFYRKRCVSWTSLFTTIRFCVGIVDRPPKQSVPAASRSLPSPF